MVYTDRVDGSRFNRVAAVDGRVGLGDAWALTFQAGGSATRDSAAVLWAPIWRASLVRSGRSFGLTVTSRGVGEDFRASSGFISRPDVVVNSATPSYTIVGAPGSWLESFNANVYLATNWDQYRHFSAGHAADDRLADFSTGFTLRGGWQVGLAWSIETFGYPGPLYANYWVERVRGGGTVVDTIPFTGTPRLPNFDYAASFQTPNFQNLSLSGSLLVGQDENYFEWANGHIIVGNLDFAWRPTARLRTELIYEHQQVIRPDDGSRVSRIRVPRLKIEYQLSRPIFLRLIGQYTSNETDALRDDSRTSGAILIRDPVTGVFTRTAPTASNAFRIDWLFSYRPTPGTVAFVGYGSSLAEPSAFRFRSLTRVGDGFFAKLSYLFRV